MKEVYVISFSAYHHRKDDNEDYETKRTFGVFDTEKRSISYLRRFLDEGEDYMEYFDKSITTTENVGGLTSAKATRRYNNDVEYVTETLTMTPYVLCALNHPNEEVTDTYC